MSEIDIISDKIKPIAKQFGLSNVWLFGSYSKLLQKESSDIDLIVKTEDVANGFKIVEVKFAFEEILGKEVDIITTGSIKDSLLENVDLHEILIYSSDNN